MKLIVTAPHSTAQGRASPSTHACRHRCEGAPAAHRHAVARLAAHACSLSKAELKLRHASHSTCRARSRAHSHQVQVASFLYHFSKAHMMHPLPYSMQDTNLWERPHLQPVDMGCLFQSLSVVAERAWITCSPVDDLRPSCHRFQIVHRRACHARPICKNRQALKQAAPGHL